MTSGNDDVIDLFDVARRIRARWAWIVAGVAAGALLAAAFNLLASDEYRASAKVLIRDAEPGASPMLASIEGMLGGMVPGPGRSVIDTELEILTSRSLAEAVIDSLGLQLAVVEPAGLPPREIFSVAQVDPVLNLNEPLVLRFERSGSAYRVRGGGVDAELSPGATLRLPVGTVALRADGLPERFTVEVLDRRDAVGWFARHLRVEEVTGDVARIEFRAADARLAAAVPNTLLDLYLGHRARADRGVNRHRYDFLVSHVDSVRAELARAESDLRRHQEVSGVFDPELYGRSEYERALELRTESEAVDVEMRALGAILGPDGGSRLSARELAAYPTFLRNAAINDLLGRILQLQTERGTLLERRTTADPEVVALDDNIAGLENQLVGLSRSYLSGLDRQREQLQGELVRYESVLSALPAQAQDSYRLQREVRRLGETLIALQTQLVQSRLAAMGEGGDVRVIDEAVVPLRPDFPNPVLNLGLGVVVGLVAGVAGAAIRGYADRRLRTPADAEGATGLPALAYDADGPLLLGRPDGAARVLVLPVCEAANSLAVARKLAAALALSADGGTVLLDVTEHAAGAEGSGALLPRGGTNGSAAAEQPGPASEEGLIEVRRWTGDARALRRATAELEERFEAVVTALPPLGRPEAGLLLAAPRTAVLVACAGSSTRDQLAHAVEVLRRMGVGVAGVVLQPARSARVRDRA